MVGKPLQHAQQTIIYSIEHLGTFSNNRFEKSCMHDVSSHEKSQVLRTVHCTTWQKLCIQKIYLPHIYLCRPFSTNALEKICEVALIYISYILYSLTYISEKLYKCNVVFLSRKQNSIWQI